MKGIFSSGSYHINLATIQAVVLLAFNPPTSATSSPVELSYDCLKTRSNLPDEAIKRVLHSFVKMKIVKKTNDSSSPSILATDVFAINEKFRFSLSSLPLLDYF